VFGGFDGSKAFTDVHLLYLSASAYLAQVTSFKIDFAEADAPSSGRP
jgi:hypothetical protein